jgi:multicomponent Na+:H+ antiporter subunit B
MIRRFFIFLVMAGVAALFAGLFINFDGNDILSPLASHYAENGKEEVGAANLVTAVVVTYRGLDTLGEVTILFLVAAIIGFFLKHSKSENEEEKSRPGSEIMQTASKVLIPIVLLLGVYVFINGHLTPGGGFQGGAIIASGFVLLLLARPDFQVNHKIIGAIESISGFAFVFLGILGIALAGGFLDNSILSLGKFGTLLSAGAIPIIYSFIGLKVGSELSNVLSGFQAVQKEKE